MDFLEIFENIGCIIAFGGTCIVFLILLGACAIFAIKGLVSTIGKDIKEYFLNEVEEEEI